MQNKILEKLQRRVSVVNKRTDHFVIGDVVGLINDLLDYCYYTDHSLQCYEYDMKRWTTGDLTLEKYEAEKKAWQEFEDSIKNYDEGTS